MPVQMKAIIPPEVEFKGLLQAEVLKSMRRMTPAISRDFKETTATWENKPRFEQSVGPSAPGPKMEVWTEDEIYGYVNDGTRPHIIRRKSAPMLAFKTGFYPKTFPGVIGSAAGGSFAPWAFAKEVHHPGTEPRRFAETLKKKWEPKFISRMNAAIRRAVKASGQGI